jgi:hypothetical protein
MTSKKLSLKKSLALSILALLGLTLVGCVSFQLPYTERSYKEPVYGSVPIGTQEVTRSYQTKKEGTGEVRRGDTSKITYEDNRGRTTGTATVKEEDKYIPVEWETHYYTTDEPIYEWQRIGTRTVTVYRVATGGTVDLKNSPPDIFSTLFYSICYLGTLPFSVPIDLIIRHRINTEPAFAEAYLTSDWYARIESRNKDGVYEANQERRIKPLAMYGLFSYLALRKKAEERKEAGAK